MILGPRAQLYVLVVSATGLAVLGECLGDLWSHPVAPDWFVLGALTLLSGSFTVKVPRIPAKISVSDTFVFASVLLFGPCAGTITVALDALIASLRSEYLSKEPVRIVFNLTSASTSIWVASQAFFWLANIPPLHEQSVRLPEIFLPLIALVAVYFVLNSVFVAVALALERNANAFVIWKNNFLWIGLNYFGGASGAALLVSYTRTVDVMTLGIIIPLLVISYLTFKTSFGRVEDAASHVEEVNRLYLSTIETLATAIDAKDQVTHGHIRRVQRYTLGLASELGVKDDNQLKALEAAALLHDTGKLVVPEHILNKPGKLSPGEFERMKLHASAGADILSSIQFPYPVVPIVRHHHENWDGTGYPDGLRSTDIPIGARILAVVDCFDALTSDRPYRGRLSDHDAMAILMQRRGTMYDPLVVDTFAAVKDKLAAAVGAEEQPSRRRPEHSRPPERPATHVIDPDFLRAAQTVLASVLTATSADLAILFLRDSNRDEAISASVVTHRQTIGEIRMPLGSGISGWVIANGRSVVNADAALDLKAQVDGLSRCTSVPIVVKGETIGALACYLGDSHGFAERELLYMENLAATFDAQPLQEVVRRTVSNIGRPEPPQSIH